MTQRGHPKRWDTWIDSYLKVFDWDILWATLGDKGPKQNTEKSRLMRHPRFLRAIVGEAKRRWLAAMASKKREGAKAWHRIYCELSKDLLGARETRPDYPNGRESETIDNDSPDNQDW